MFDSSQILDSIFRVEPKKSFDGLDVGYERKRRQNDSKVLAEKLGTMVLPLAVRWEAI